MRFRRKVIQLCKVGSSNLLRPNLYQARALHSFSYTREVKEALSNGEPVVALESTIITHGMPHPANIDMARKVESIVRGEGAVPATIAIIKGNIHVGLSSEELEELAITKNAIKVSRAELPYALGKQMNGGTTVAGTMIIAHKAGIKVFVTGGVGGVHRGAETTMDISADLTELGRTPVMVVSAGVKSILDIGLTLEYLETMGVCVTTYGKEGVNFPAFYSPDSGFRSPLNVASPMEAARVMKSNLDLNLGSGMLVGVPIPENEAAFGIQEAVDKALAEAEQQNVKGKQITPFLLARLNELTAGDSLRANIALVQNNARIGAQIACSLAQLSGLKSQQNPPPANQHSTKKGPVVIGGSNFDFVVKVDEKSIEMTGATHYGKLQFSSGGVGSNLANALARLGNSTRLISAVGDDKPGNNILRETMHIDTSLVRKLPDESTATYTAILDRSGECIFGVGDMDIHSQVTRDYLASLENKICNASIFILDGNISEDTIDYALELCAKYNIPVLYEPTCLRKAVKPLSSKYLGKVVTYVSPNLNELMSMAETLPNFKIQETNDLKYLADISNKLLEYYGFDLILLTLGVDGVLLTRRGAASEPLPFMVKQAYESGRISSVHYESTPVQDVVSVSGAGDCFTAAFITGLLKGMSQDSCVTAGIQAARSSCKVGPAIPDTLADINLDWYKPVQANTIL